MKFVSVSTSCGRIAIQNRNSPCKDGRGREGREGGDGGEGGGGEKEDEVAHSEAVSPMQLFSVE